MVYSWLNNVQRWLLPGRCVVCRGPAGRPVDICAPCEGDLLSPWPRCQHCGLPSNRDTSHCGQCLADAFRFRRCIPLCLYHHPIDQLITEFKHQGQLANGKVLGQLLAQVLAQAYRGSSLPEVILPVPLHWRRQWRRGFNQAHYLAGVVGKQLDIPVRGDILRRSRATPSQQGMDRRQRQRNLSSAFEVQRAGGYRHIALIDDVVTTGSTANILSGCLMDAGVGQVDVWCLARTPCSRRGRE